jgi:hypothetical protein
MTDNQLDHFLAKKRESRPILLEVQIKRQRLQEDEARHAQGYLEKPVVPGEFDEWQGEQDWGAR